MSPIKVLPAATYLTVEEKLIGVIVNRFLQGVVSEYRETVAEPLR